MAEISNIYDLNGRNGYTGAGDREHDWVTYRSQHLTDD